MEDRIRKLEQRVSWIEQTLARNAPSRPPPAREWPKSPSDRSTRPPHPAQTARPPQEDIWPTRRASPLSEEELIGTWFPRVGVLALVLGAAFGFMYAVEQGLIEPAVRVLLGLLAGTALLFGGERARRRGWHPFAQAVCGGGIALLYLTFWASWHLYGYLTPGVSCAALAAVSALGVGISLRHNGEALAIVAILGAFWSPFATDVASGGAANIYAYALAIDIAVIALAYARPWRVLTKVAFTSTWFVLSAVEGSNGSAILAASLAFVLFGSIPYIRALGTKQQAHISDALLLVSNGLVYYSVILVRLNNAAMGSRGLFTLFMASVYFAGVVPVRKVGSARPLYSSSLGMAILFITIWVPVELGTRWAPLLWGIEAAILFGSGRYFRDRSVTAAAWIVLITSIGVQFESRVFLSAHNLTSGVGRAAFIAQIGALYLFALLEKNVDTHEEPSPRALGLVAANAYTVVWLSIEVLSIVDDAQFALSGLWGVYAGALLIVGIAFRSHTCRILSVSLFALTVAKMGLVDIWSLPTGQRLVGFVGIGVLLLGCSLMYHQLKDRYQQPT